MTSPRKATRGGANEPPVLAAPARRAIELAAERPAERPERPERVLVCIGASPASERLVHAAHRLAAGMDAPWHAVHVDVTGAAPLAADDRDRVEAHLALAEALGGDVARLAGRSVAEAVLAFSRERGVTRVLAGKPTHRRWRDRLRDRLRGSVLDALIRGPDDLEIHVIAPGGELRPRAAANPGPGRRLASFAPGAVAVACATALGIAAGDRLALADDAMLYLFAIMIAALGGRAPGIAAAALAVAVFDFFFVPPRFTFAVNELHNLMTFAVMFTLGTAMGSLVARLRHAETASRQRERRTQTLLAFTAAAARATDVADIAAAVVAHVEDGLAAPAAVLIAEPDGLAAAAGLAPLAATELEVAHRAHAQRRAAGRGTETQPSARVLAVPLWVGSDGSAGAVVVQIDRARRRIDLEGRRLLEAIARQAGVAIARLGLAAEARDAEVRARAEELRSSLLSTVSHDLRTPLAIITGTATALRDEAPALTAAQLESLDTIVDEASRLGTILTNLLAITRVESGAELHRDWVPLDELVGSALERSEPAVAGRALAIELAPDIGAEVDPILIEQVLHNLLDNAAKHTPPGTPIEICGFREAGGVAIEISDRGPGLPPGPDHQVFEKFYRGPQARTARTARTAGAGLGLAVCRGIANAHGGTIEARRRPGGGATFHLWLPGGDAPAEPPRPGAVLEAAAP